MRIELLELTAFGPFSDATLAFDDRSAPTVHVVYGPNEAGKSSTLRAIHAALFGIPHNSRDNFRHDYRAMRVGCCVSSQAGESLHFVRRKGRTQTLLNPNLDHGGAYPDDALNPYLGAVDESTFRRVYGIDHDELLRGGQAMLQLRGLAGESLLAASLGATELGTVLSKLDGDADQLFSRKRNARIRLSIKTYRELVAERRKHEIPVSRWTGVQQELDDRRRQRDTVVLEWRRARGRLRELGRLRDAVRWFAEQQRLRTELTEFEQRAVLPDDYSASDRSRIQGELEQLRLQLAATERELDGDGGLVAQLAEGTNATPIADHSETIDGFQERLGAYLKAQADLSTNLFPDRDETLAVLQSMADELQLDATEDDVDRVRVPRARRILIQELAADAKRLAGRVEDLKSDRDRLRLTLSAVDGEREQLADPIDVSALEAIVERATLRGDRESEMTSLADECARLEHLVAERRASLGVISMTSADVETAVPLRETVESFQREAEELESDRRRLDDAAAVIAEELDEVARDMEAIKGTGPVPQKSTLTRRRSERDERWRLIRRVWLDGNKLSQIAEGADYSTADDLSAAFQTAMAEADDVADRLCREADRVTRMAACQQRQRQLKRRAKEIEGDRRGWDKAWSIWSERWKTLWGTARIDSPLSPHEMLGWLQRWESFRNAAIEQQQASRRRDDMEASSLEETKQLEQELERVGVAATAVDRGSILSLARGTLQTQHDLRQRHEELAERFRDVQKDADRVNHDVAAAEARLGDWQQRWAAEMQTLELSSDALPEQATDRLTQLAEFCHRVDTARRLSARIEAIQRESAVFEGEVSGLAERIAPDLLADATSGSSLPLSTSQLAVELRGRLETLHADLIHRDHLEERKLECEQQRRELESKIGSLESQLLILCRLAGVESDSELPAIEEASREVKVRVDRLREVEEQLRELADGHSIESLEERLAGRGLDAIEQEMGQLEDEAERLEEERDRLVGEVRELENESRSLDGSAAAAEADEQALATLAGIHSDAEQYVRLRVAAAVLRTHIARHRAEHEDPILGLASDYFSRLTLLEFVGLHIDYDLHDEPVIVGVRRKGTEVVTVEAMSDGTRDQLYLALRLAYLDRQLSTREPLPLVVDDILIQSDDARAAAALELLAEFAEKTQVLFFTHHRRLVELAMERLPSEAVHVLELPASHANI